MAHPHPTSMESHEPNPPPLSLLLFPSWDPPYKYSLSCLIPFLQHSLSPCLHQPKCLRNNYLRAIEAREARSVRQRSPWMEGQRGHHIKLRKVKPGLELAQEREAWYSLQTWKGRVIWYFCLGLNNSRLIGLNACSAGGSLCLLLFPREKKNYGYH